MIIAPGMDRGGGVAHKADLMMIAPGMDGGREVAHKADLRQSVFLWRRGERRKKKGERREERGEEREERGGGGEGREEGCVTAEEADLDRVDTLLCIGFDQWERTAPSRPKRRSSRLPPH